MAVRFTPNIFATRGCKVYVNSDVIASEDLQKALIKGMVGIMNGLVPADWVAGDRFIVKVYENVRFGESIVIYQIDTQTNNIYKEFTYTDFKLQKTGYIMATKEMLKYCTEQHIIVNQICFTVSGGKLAMIEIK